MPWWISSGIRSYDILQPRRCRLGCFLFGWDKLSSNKTFSQRNEAFAGVATAILDRVLHYCTVINIKGESYLLKEQKEFMRQKLQIVNFPFEQ